MTSPTLSPDDWVTAYFAGEAEMRTSPDLRIRVIDHEALVLRQEKAEVLGLNPVGTRILQAISDGVTAQELVDQLETDFDVERGRLVEDVQGFMVELIESGLLSAALEAEP